MAPPRTLPLTPHCAAACVVLVALLPRAALVALRTYTNHVNNENNGAGLRFDRAPTLTRLLPAECDVCGPCQTDQFLINRWSAPPRCDTPPARRVNELLLQVPSHAGSAHHHQHHQLAAAAAPVFVVYAVAVGQEPFEEQRVE